MHTAKPILSPTVQKTQPGTHLPARGTSSGRTAKVVEGDEGDEGGTSRRAPPPSATRAASRLRRGPLHGGGLLLLLLLVGRRLGRLVVVAAEREQRCDHAQSRDQFHGHLTSPSRTCSGSCTPSSTRRSPPST